MFQESPEWKAAYIAALFETDRQLIPSRVACARRLLTDRLCQLRHTVEQRSERDRMEQALKMLDLLLKTEVLSTDVSRRFGLSQQADVPGSHVQAN